MTPPARDLDSGRAHREELGAARARGVWGWSAWARLGGGDRVCRRAEGYRGSQEVNERHWRASEKGPDALSGGEGGQLEVRRSKGRGTEAVEELPERGGWMVFYRDRALRGRGRGLTGWEEKLRS